MSQPAIELITMARRHDHEQQKGHGDPAQENDLCANYAKHCESRSIWSELRRCIRVMKFWLARGGFRSLADLLRTRRMLMHDLEICREQRYDPMGAGSPIRQGGIDPGLTSRGA
jgi:hypothetical protein